MQERGREDQQQSMKMKKMAVAQRKTKERGPLGGFGEDDPRMLAGLGWSTR